MSSYSAYIIRDTMNEWKKEAGVHHLVLYRFAQNLESKEWTLTICTDRPGPFIGFMGTRIERYSTILQDRFGYKVNVEFIETHEII